MNTQTFVAAVTSDTAKELGYGFAKTAVICAGVVAGYELVHRTEKAVIAAIRRRVQNAQNQTPQNES